MVREKGVLKKKEDTGGQISSVSRSDSADVVLKLTIEKHSSLNQYFYGSDDYLLLNPDKKIVDKIPSSEESFTVK